MRVLFLLGALWFILTVARRWDQLHPLRTAAQARGSMDTAGGVLEEQSPYLDLTLLDAVNGRRPSRVQAAFREAGYPAGTLVGRRTA